MSEILVYFGRFEVNNVGRLVMTLVTHSLDPPNGGWRWMVVLGAQLINVCNQSLLSVFGLIFGPFFATLNESKTRIALVMNLCSAFLNLTGLITAPIMKKLSPREVAICGSLLVSAGLMFSSFAINLPQIIFTYSFMVGIGLGLLGPAIFLAVSSYFTTKKSRAIGFAMAGTGLGQMIFPQVVRFLLAEYGFKGTVLIMGSLSLHGVVGACLFQPVRWHLKRNKMSEVEPLLRPSAVTSHSEDVGVITRVARSMDLSLLKDVHFLLLNFGLACAYTVSIDFSLILPFFLQVSFFLSFLEQN